MRGRESKIDFQICPAKEREIRVNLESEREKREGNERGK